METFLYSCNQLPLTATIFPEIRFGLVSRPRHSSWQPVVDKLRQLGAKHRSFELGTGALRFGGWERKRNWNHTMGPG